jgi:acyl-coenzyme A synthetase/AMP-(fatty) acid ligase
LPGVRVPDDLRGQAVKAFVIPRVDATDELGLELQRFIRGRLAAYAYPRNIEFVDGLPLTAT